MLWILSCQQNATFRQKAAALRFCAEREEERLFEKKVNLLRCNRSRHLPSRKLAETCQKGTVLLSSRILQKDREKLVRAGVRVFCAQQSSPFRLWLALNCALSLLEESGQPFPCQALGIIDPNFCCTELIRHALLHLTQVRVLTQNLPAAQRFAARMMDEYGAPLLYSDDEAVLPAQGLTFSPHGILPQRDLPLMLPFYVETGERRAPIFDSPAPVLPQPLKQMLPEDIDGALLMEALATSERCSFLLGCRAQSVVQRTPTGPLCLCIGAAAGALSLEALEGKRG